VSYVIELARRLPGLDQSIEWLVFATPAAAALVGQIAPNARYVLCKLPVESIVVRALWEQTALLQLAHRFCLDVLFAPVNVAPIGYRGKTLLTMHEAEPFMPDPHIPLPLLAWWRTMRSISARKATRILTVSDAARSELTRWMRLDPDRVDVVHLGVDLERFSVAARSSDAPLAGAPYVLWVGRPYPRKNLDTLLRAFAELRSAGRPEHLVLIGPPGWHESAVVERIASEFPDRSVLRLPAMWSELPKWYAHAAVFVFPSIQETFGLPVLESMACGTPVVAANIDSLREVGGDAAVYVAPRSVGDLAIAVGRLLDSPSEADELRQAGLARAAAFDWAATAQKTLAILRAATSANPPRNADCRLTHR
jgi:glycosyltransferase involved in cell wall biosynthesis